jgi:hypothetical protein
VWAPKCVGDPEICMHDCVPIIRIAVHGCACRGDKGAHDMCACLLHNHAWVCGYVVDRRALMHAFVRDRGTWRHPCRVGRHACMCTYDMDKHACMRACGMDMHTYVHARGVNRDAYVRTYGLNSRALDARLMGEKIIFFNVFNGQYG